MNMISWLLFGFVAGIIAIFAQRLSQLSDILTTLMLGVLGALLGGLLATIILGNISTSYNMIAGLLALSSSLFFLNLSRKVRRT